MLFNKDSIHHPGVYTFHRLFIINHHYCYHIPLTITISKYIITCTINKIFDLEKQAGSKIWSDSDSDTGAGTIRAC